MKSVFVQSFGCRASQADGASIRASLEQQGYTAVPCSDQADLIVLNTCTVTNSADIDTRRIIRGLQRDTPRAQILVTGCYAQRAPDEIAALGVKWVVGNSHKHQIADIVANSHEPYHGRVVAGDISEQRSFTGAISGSLREDRTRPNLKVQDGCGNRCAFCIIPSVRGRSRSAPLEDVLEETKRLSSRHAEVVLTGINLGRWGRDLAPSLRFVDLLSTILERTDVRRLRISSVEPMDWSEELFQRIAATPRIARHVHIPLQSGSDAVLKRMRRKYRTRHYSSRLELAYRLLPDAAIGADVMTGFPGETEAEFVETVRFIEDRPFTYLHVFTYSERPGTPAATAPNPVPVSVRRERTEVLRRLSDKKNLEFRTRLVGKTVSAVTLEQAGFALTTNFVRVELAQVRTPGQIVDLPLGQVSDSGMRERTLLPVIK